MKLISDIPSLNYHNDGIYAYKEYGGYSQIKVCPMCKQEYKRYAGEVKYIYGKKAFCSWTCKCRYMRLHPGLEVKKDHVQEKIDRIQKRRAYDSQYKRNKRKKGDKTNEETSM